MTTLDPSLLDDITGAGVLGPGVYMFGPPPTDEQRATWHRCLREAEATDSIWNLWAGKKKCDADFDQAVWNHKFAKKR